MSKKPSATYSSSEGSFANDPEKASEAGKKGRQQSHQQSVGSSRSQQGESDTLSGKQRGGSGNFANDPERASEEGRKGGEQSHKNQ